MAFALMLALVSAASAPPVLATYRGGQITAQEYAGWLGSQNLKDDPSRRRVQLEGLALAKSLEAAALAGGLDRDAAGRFRLEEAERSVLAQACLRHEDLEIQVSDADVEAEIQAEKAELVKPRRVRLRNIFKRVPEGAGPEERAAVRARMQELRRRLEQGADFDALALAESDSQTRFQRGVMGAIPPGVLQPAVEAVAFALKPGELSPVIETPDGFTLLRCDGVIQGRVMSLDEARGMIRQGLWRRRSEARRQQLREELLGEASLQDDLDAALADGRDDAVAVRFQGGSLSLGELRQLAGSHPEAEPRQALLRQCEEYVFRLKLAERARREGLDRDPGTSARVRWARARCLATLEITRRINQVLVPPTAAEIRAQFDAEGERYLRPAETDLSLIELPLGPGSPRRELDEARRLAGALASGRRDFAEAARAVSRHASAPAGGRLGWQDPRQLAGLGPNVFRALSATEPGHLVGPVEQDRSLWILKVWGRRPARPLTFQEARGRAEQDLGNARVAELQQRLEAAARKVLDLRVAPGAGAASP